MLRYVHVVDSLKVIHSDIISSYNDASSTV